MHSERYRKSLQNYIQNKHFSIWYSKWFTLDSRCKNSIFHLLYITNLIMKKHQFCNLIQKRPLSLYVCLPLSETNQTTLSKNLSTVCPYSLTLPFGELFLNTLKQNKTKKHLGTTKNILLTAIFSTLLKVLKHSFCISKLSYTFHD